MLASARQRFLADYTSIRHAEGRGSADAAYYLALPYRDITGRLQDQWAHRAKSYDHFVRSVLEPDGRPLKIADLGAGNCWMSYRLALRGHYPVAIDILDDPLDGLAAGRHYQQQTPFARLRAEFDDLPIAAHSLDLVIFNASIHYSTDYRRTLAEARRCLRADGRFVIVDSPVYRHREHGEMMRIERHRQFEKQYGTASDALPSIEYFDEEMLAELAREMNISWTIHRPWYGWRWTTRPFVARWKGKRPPSRFWILEGRFAS